jgi:Dolichyl-phosphate-mannose-protein mannosyltransferase
VLDLNGATRAKGTATLRALQPNRRALTALGAGALLCFVFFNLTRFPATWFDEGSHLHVPKTLVTLGRYADFSDGELRYYGPTVGVGPTVMLPVAAAFKVAGVGLVQARVVMAVYLLLAVGAFLALARRVGGPSVAGWGALLLLTSPTIGIIENGRQVLGEVPGLFFLCSGLAWWFTCWEKPGWQRLVGSSFLLALACITKHVYLISILPGLVAAAALNLIYYRKLPHLVFIVPILVVGAVFSAWQVVLVAGLGPGTAAQNLRLLQDATRGAALVFSTENMRRAAGELLSIRALGGWLPPALMWTGLRQFSRQGDDQRWGTIWLMAVANLGWYVLASAGWPRYAFAGLTLSCLLVGRLVQDLVDQVDRRTLVSPASMLRVPSPAAAGLAVAVWLAVVSAGFLARTAVKIVTAPYPASQRMAEYLDEHVAQDRVIHTWEPEMSVLSEHRYHFPPPQLLIVAVAHQWNGGPPVAESFDFERDVQPDYVLEGPFSAYVQLYPKERLDEGYRLVTKEGGYTLYERRRVAGQSSRETKAMGPVALRY